MRRTDNLDQIDAAGESLGDVEATNIDGFQGHKRDVIVLSLVRSNSDGRLGHVDDGRRLNVALTRAKRGLVVIGDKDTLKIRIGKWAQLFYQKRLRAWPCDTNAS